MCKQDPPKNGCFVILSPLKIKNLPPKNGWVWECWFGMLNINFGLVKTTVVPEWLVGFGAKCWRCWESAKPIQGSVCVDKAVVPLGPKLHLKVETKVEKKIIKQSTNFNTKTKTKDFMEQLQQGFSNSTQSEMWKIGEKVLWVHYN